MSQRNSYQRSEEGFGGAILCMLMVVALVLYLI